MQPLKTGEEAIGRPPPTPTRAAWQSKQKREEIAGVLLTGETRNSPAQAKFGRGGGGGGGGGMRGLGRDSGRLEPLR